VVRALDETPVSPNQVKMRSTTAARQDNEALRVVAPLGDLHAQPQHLCQRSVNLPGIVAAISPYH